MLVSEPDNPSPSTNGDGRPQAAAPDQALTHCVSCNQTIAQRHVCDRCGRPFCSVDCLRRHASAHNNDDSSPNVAVPVVAGVLAALVGGLFLFIFLTAQPMGAPNTGPEAFEAMKPVATLTATQLVSQFIRDFKGTEASYFDKPIEIEGQVEITYPQRSPPLLVLKGINANSRVQCHLRRGVDLTDVQPGTVLVVRGFFRGRDQSAIKREIIVIDLVEALYRRASDPSEPTKTSPP
jgi:hypothetical protein